MEDETRKGIERDLIKIRASKAYNSTKVPGHKEAVEDAAALYRTLYPEPEKED